jgi:RNA polymerase sigma-54 factor
MALAQRQELRQSQSLVMTPQLQQAIKLLQLANVELVEYVDAQIAQNPLLELSEGAGEGEATEGGEASSAEAETPLDIDYDDIYAAEGKSDHVADPRAAFSNGGSNGGSGGGSGGFDIHAPGIDQTLTREQTLREHLLA